MTREFDRPKTAVDRAIERHPWLFFVMLGAMVALMGLAGAME